MASYTEPTRPLEAVLYETPELSRESITIVNGTAAFDAGMVLGRTLTSGTATAVGFPTNTASVGAVGTITVGGAAKIGTYTLTVVEPATNAGSFVLVDPEGITVGKGDVASEFDAGGLTFTVADATPDFGAGDGFHIHVAGAYHYAPFDDGNTDGTNVARAIALYGCDASEAATDVAAITRLAAVKSAALKWHASADATAKAQAAVDLAKATILVRS